jgi:hypothetical protein
MPYGSIHDDLRGMFRGDGMLAPPARDPFWDRLGLTPDEVRIHEPPGRPFDKAQDLVFSAKPNPFNPGVTFRICGNRDFPDLVLKILEVNGKVIHSQAVPLEKGRVRTLTWQAPDRPSTVYVAVLKAKRLTLTRKLTLIK